MADDARGSNAGGLGSLLRLAIMLLLGGAVAFPFVAQSGSQSAGGREARAGSSGTGASGQKAQKADPHTDALMLMGEFVGLDVTDPVLDAQAAKSASATGDYALVTAEEWKTFSREDLRYELVRRAFKQRTITPQFLIATVPDPVNSNASWTFDPLVSAISSAAAASGFLTERFYIPDWSAEPDGSGDSARPGARHEKWPGVVLFRSAGYTASPPDRRLLVTLLVFETPTAGIHQEAFGEAVRIAARWSPDETIPVLGPTFSGSLASLRNAVEARPATRFRIVTGSATSQGNITIREAPNVTFKATVQSDAEVTDKLVEYLAETGSIERMALLVEGDTSYGRALATPWPAGTRILPFPLQISRLRSAATAQTQPGASSPAAGSVASRLLGLSLGQSGAPTDQIPSMTPGTTSSAVELELSQILDVIRRDHITTVGLLATDTRDKLFLAQLLARRSAAVRLFTIESDLFYAHPDYSQYVRGMIVASSYPLFAQNQGWVDGASVRQQFPTTMAEGVYNATVLLLNYDGDGNPLAGGAAPLDYRLPGTEDLQPPIWISVVGDDAIWPVRWYRSKDTNYLHAAKAARALLPGQLMADVSAWVVFGLGVFAGVAGLHVLLYVRRHRLEAWNLDGRPFTRFFAKRGFERRRPYLFVAFIVLAVAWGYVCTLMTLSIVALAPSRLGFWPDVAGTGLSAALLVGLLACALDLGRQTGRGAFNRFSGRSIAALLREPQYVLMLFALGCAIVAAIFGFAYLVSVFRRPHEAVYYFARVTHPGNRVSPAAPMFLIVGVIYLWAFVHLRRLSAVRGESIERALKPLRLLTGGEIVQPAAQLGSFIDGAVQKLPPLITAVVLLPVLIGIYLAKLHPLSSPEPMWFTYSFQAAWLVLQILLWLAFAHVGYFWYTLRKAMHAFAGTPMIGAFKRLSPDLFHDRLSPRQPDDADIRKVGYTAAQLGLALEKLAAGYEDVTGKLKSLAPSGVPPDPQERKAPWADRREWVAINDVVPDVAKLLARFWSDQPRPSALWSIDIDAEIEDAKVVKSDLQRWMMRAEEFLAMHVLLVVRELLSRLVNVFFYVIVAVMLMVAVQQSFPFEPRQDLLGVTWVYVLGAVILVMTIIIQMEHDEVLSAFSSTKSGALNWDVALWSKVLVYGIIPIASVFAAQFPSIGTTILDWLAPVQKALP